MLSHLVSAPHFSAWDGDWEGRNAEKRTWLCEGNDDMTDDLRVQLLDDHNRYRSLTARGLAEDPEGDNGYAPKAAKMKKLVYDCNLEVSAQDHANLCKFQHSNVPYGENLFYAPMFFDKYQAVDTASRMWFDELKKFGVGPENMLKNWSVGHYTQMVWGWTEKLGCGVKECLDGSVLLVCQYDPAGNYQQYPIYKVGEPCSDCTCKQCECDPDEGLCYVPELPTSEPGSDFAS
ncbi:hypothetical protein Q1695_003168 [Nippostrongylus brasiliensis]|nr:hypothetical protein Q1695_003168 [Nippostrongylus brasiliensis]